jgi:hypothetical protein
MRRVRSALQEWFQLRARLHEERQFHLEQAGAEFRGLGWSPSEAEKKALARYGSRRNQRTARRELGGDLRGLARMLREHRIGASVWLQPAFLCVLIASMLGLSSASRHVSKTDAGRVVFHSAHGAYPWGITPS